MGVKITYNNQEISLDLDKTLTLSCAEKVFRSDIVVNGVGENEEAKIQYNTFLNVLKNHINSDIQTGIFGADMKVELLNDGPVTIFIDSRNKE